MSNCDFKNPISKNIRSTKFKRAHYFLILEIPGKNKQTKPNIPIIEVFDESILKDRSNATNQTC